MSRDKKSKSDREGRREKRRQKWEPLQCCV
jgi:hypothetical protein